MNLEKKYSLISQEKYPAEKWFFYKKLHKHGHKN